MSSDKKRLAIFASGTGSNMETIIKVSKNSNYPAAVCVVISDKKDAPALEKARAHSVPSIFINPKVFDSQKDYEQMLAATLKQYQIDLVVLAGFMRVLSSYFVNSYKKRILNIHPSLLPKYPGLNAVKQTLEAGESETGCTVHYVDEGIDTGPIIAQTTVPIQEGDTVDSLHQRIHTEEHKLYPEAIKSVIAKFK